MSKSGHARCTLLETEERFRLLVDSVKDYAIFMLDPNGIVSTWNPGAERIKGYTAEEIIGRHISTFYLPADRAAGKAEEELAVAAAAGRTENEGWRVRKDGKRFWADVVLSAIRAPGSGELIGFAKVTRDLTDRREAEQRLKTSEELFRMLVERVPEYAIFMLDPTGHVISWNVGAERIKGYKANEIIGQSFERFYTPRDREAGRPQHLLAEAARVGHVKDSAVRVRKDGTLFHAEVLITAIRDEKGILLGYSKLTRDITDQIRSRELEAAKLAAEKANAAKDEFLAVLSHELRTPLTPVLAAASYMEEHARDLPPELREEVSTIKRNLQLEAQLIDDLLDLTRISRGKIELHPEALDVAAALRHALDIASTDADAKELQLELHLDAPSHLVWGDATRLRQVFWNLFTNAVKFTPARGRITVRTHNAEEDRLIVEVSDTGAGIEPEVLGRIFNRFEQGERGITRKFGGLGLGLAISKSLVEAHRGTIAAESAGRGQGATFRVCLPLLKDYRADLPPAESKPAEPVRPLRILLVEDHDDTRRILSRLLRQAGHEVQVATTVALACEALEESPFDLLISDLGLPDGDGLTVVREAKARQPLKAIAMSGFGMEEDINRSRAAGFDVHLTKPVDFHVLQQTVRDLGAKRPAS